MKKVLLFLCITGFSCISFAVSGASIRADNIKNIGLLNGLIDSIKGDHVFTDCSQYEDAMVDAIRSRISMYEQVSELSYKYDTVETDVGSRFSAGVPQSVINNAVLKELDKLGDQWDVLVVQDAQLSVDVSNAGTRYDTCQNDQLKIYNQYLMSAKAYTIEGKISETIEVLEKAKNMAYSGTAQYSFAAGKIDELNKVKDAYEKQMAIEEKKHNDAATAAALKAQNIEKQKVSTDQEILATSGIIVKQDDVTLYRLNDNISRQEALGVAMKVGNFDLSQNYSCKGMFSDVLQLKPNNWICRAVEIGADNGIVSVENKMFRPLDSVSRIEALALIMKSAGITIVETSNISVFTDVTIPWQINVTNTAINLGLVDSGTNFYPNQKATRAEVFNFARRIFEYMD